jgi:hypothetical protein
VVAQRGCISGDREGRRAADDLFDFGFGFGFDLILTGLRHELDTRD